MDKAECECCKCDNKVLRNEEILVTINFKKVDHQNKDEIKKIYTDLFPLDEMFPYDLLIEISNDTDHLFFALYEDEALIGMNYLILEKDLLYVLYLAIGKNNQSKGYGKSVIQEILRKYPQKRIFLNIEEVDSKYENYNQRAKRKSFYQSLGFVSQNYLYVSGKGVSFETMAVNGSVSREEVGELFDYFKTLD